MAFDQSTRNRLSRFVSDARALLSEEFTRQLQHEYGMDPATGDVAELERLTQLDDARRETARILRDTMQHYLAGTTAKGKKARQEVLDRIVREQAFTVLNRLCALRMMEARGLLIDSLAKGYQSRGFQLYARLAGTALGETGDAYRAYLFSLFDEFAVDLAVLFDRFSPHGRLFPRESVLLELLEKTNHPDIEPLWAEDETIGWIYQYFNSQEERRQMRAESQAPRNSRELAVRNQFFTPRYVVEFLTDNTLGRIWYEMTQGQTRLVDLCRYLVRRPMEIFLSPGEEAPQQSEPGADLSQEELLKLPVYIPHRPLKDPRTILMLDPACGSLHFGLYACDLYEVIYDEAWELEARYGPAALLRSEGLKPLHETYPDKQAFLRDVPRLIIEHNIHGIDIDPRAVQIAGLSLWLRAQRSWQQQGVKAHERPIIHKSNIVCAEPMPGDKTQLDEFLKGLREERLETLIRRVLDVPENQRVRATPTMADALCELVSTVWHEMELAGEAGSLLKIEESLAAAIDHARNEWEQRLPLFRVETFRMTEGEAEKPKVNYLHTVPGEDEDFWDRAEALVLAALEEYAEQAQHEDGYARRLFAADAARGFAFIDLCRKRYDVVLMNPPFGDSAIDTLSYLNSNYDAWTRNVLCCFIIRGKGKLDPPGRLGVIFDRTAAIKSSYEDFRRHHLVNSILSVADTGWNVLDANVETTVFILGSDGSDRTRCFLDLRASPSNRDKELMLRRQIGLCKKGEVVDGSYVVLPSTFLQLPNAVIGYYFDTFLLNLFDSCQSLEESGIQARKGHDFISEEHFRLHWEIWNLSGVGRTGEFCTLYNGSSFTMFATPMRDVVLQRGDAYRYDAHRSVTLRNKSFHFRSGIGYGKRGDLLDAHILCNDVIFTSEGLAATDLDNSTALIGLAYLNSSLAQHAINTYCGQHKQVGYVNKLPFPRIDGEHCSIITSLASKIIDLKRVWFQRDETTREFVCVAHLGCPDLNQLTMNALIDKFVDKYNRDKAKFAKLINENDHVFAEIAGIHGRGNDVLRQLAIERPDDGPWPGIASELGSRSYSTMIADQIVSYALGTILGRWDIRYATGQNPLPSMPDPFDALPTRPPGMLQSDNGLPITPADVPADYPLRISWRGILVDDSGHGEDIVARVREALTVISPDNADATEQEACQFLGVDGLRAYFANANQFFADHLRRYSKSRRVAPIYWPLSTPSGSYTLWLYYHRISDQILYTSVNDFVDPKLNEVSGQVADLRRKGNRSREDENELERLSDLELELKDFRAEMLRIAQFWRPNLNDGVQITAAPLWRLFQHRQWQNRLKDTWEMLEAGDYDWAHLAMSIWPARVVPKCLEDRSLAIAHDVEDLFWVEDVDGWRNLRAPAAELEAQRQRHRQSLTGKQRERIVKALTHLSNNEGRSMACEQVAQHLAEGDWDDTEVALLFWPERVAEKCLDDPFLADRLRMNLPPKRTKTALKRWVKQLVGAGCPDWADALLASLDDEDATLTHFVADLQAGRRDHAPLALALYPERVVDQCTADVDLAEIHGLRRFLWVQEADGNWRRRSELQREVMDEVQRRS